MKQSITWYRVWCKKITPVNVVEVTDGMLRIEGSEHPVARECGADKYFPTKGEAIDELERQLLVRKHRILAELADIEDRLETTRKERPLL